MISHEHQLIFIHIPKCAGTSIESAFGHFDDHTGRRGQDHRPIRMIEQPVLTTHIIRSQENVITALKRLRQPYRKGINPRNKLSVTREQYDRYYKFAFIRNPWARVFSWYKNVMRDEVHRKRHQINGQLSLYDFLQRFAGKGMLRPQTYWLEDFSGSIPLDFVGRFETLSEDFHKICEAIGISPITLPHKMKGRGEDYRDSYNSDSIQLVSTVYREEIEMFGYSFS